MVRNVKVYVFHIREGSPRVTPDVNALYFDMFQFCKLDIMRCANLLSSTAAAG